MRLLIIGCEYAGKTPLARSISHRLLAAMASRTGPRPIQWHNHFVVPRLDGHLIVRAPGDRTIIGKEAADLNTADRQRLCGRWVSSVTGRAADAEGKAVQ